MNTRRKVVAMLSFLIAACTARAVSAETAAPTAASAVASPAVGPSAKGSQRLNALFEQYFEEYLQLNPLVATYIGDNRYNDSLPNDLSTEFRAKARAMNERYLAAICAIDPATLSGEDRISYEIFLRERARERDAERFPTYLLPVQQTGGLPTLMPALGSGTNAQPFVTVQDYENWLKRLDGFVVWMDQAIVNMREGVASGVVQPRPVMEKVLPQLDAMIVAQAEDGLFCGPVGKFADSVPACERGRLKAAYKAAIESQVVPAYRRMRDFVRDEYLPKARTSVAWTALPDGKAWYEFYVQEHTTTDLAPEEIHQIGLSEVSRILGEMDGVRRQVGCNGDLHGFFEFVESDPQFYFTQGADLVQRYRELKARVDAALPKLFSVFPKADYVIREVEPFRARSAAGGSYEPPSADGSRPGIFYVNTFNLMAQPIAVLEAAVGRWVAART